MFSLKITWEKLSSNKRNKKENFKLNTNLKRIEINFNIFKITKIGYKSRNKLEKKWYSCPKEIIQKLLNFLYSKT